ncbi:MAG: calcium/sodium antiporter [Bdellovibrio sp.]
MWMQVLLLVGSIVALYFGAELALEAAEKIGKFFGLSPLVIGLVLIGFGTSLPELFVSQLAAYRGVPTMAMGNVVGSNVANLFLILGLSGIFANLYILRKEIFLQLIYHIVVTLLLGFVLWWKRIDYITSSAMLVFFSMYLSFTFHEMKKQRQTKHIHDAEDEKEIAELGITVVVKLLAGFLLLYFGGEYLVSSGSIIARELGISEFVISAIFVAFGTSFPEFVTALVASIKKKNTDIITGNIIGSNIFNVAFILGTLGIYKIDIQDNYWREWQCLMFAALFLTILYLFKRNFSRIPGLIFLSFYVGMIIYWI